MGPGPSVLGPGPLWSPTGDEIINLLKGIDPTRENPSDDDDGSKTLSGSVPKTGGKAQKSEPGLQGT